MPAFTTTPNAFLSQFVRPFADKVGAIPAYNTFVGAVSFAMTLLGQDMDQEITFTIPNPFPSSGGGGGGGGGGNASPPNLLPPIPSLQPIDPALVLNQLAEALSAAERVLNKENLAIGGATAEVNVVVQVGGLAGANATLKINLGPTPRG